MADVSSTGGNLLTQKWGPVPVWVYALGGLLAAWAFAYFRNLKQAAAANTAQQQPDVANATDGADEGQAVAPQFIIENNLPQTPSAPVPPPTAPPPAVTPPSTTPTPPVVSKPTPSSPSTPSTPPPKTVTPPAKKAPIQYKVKSGDTLSTIAAKYHTTADALWAYNTTPGNRPASTIATLKARGKDLIFANETILIPQ